MNEVLGCPFCGVPGTVEYVDKNYYSDLFKGSGRYKGYYVECQSNICNYQPTSSFVFDTEEEAIEDWNRRAGDE